MRHADAGYERAIEVARERGVRIPMLDIALPHGACATCAARGRRADVPLRAAGPRRALRARARGAPLLLTGPPGAGKTRCCYDVADALRAQGWVAVYLDLMGAASSPERFVVAALGSLPAERFASRMAEATAIRRLAAAGRARGAAAVQALFALWASLDEAGGRPVVLLLDEVTEIRSLAYFAGLREVGSRSPRPWPARRAARC